MLFCFCSIKLENVVQLCLTDSDPIEIAKIAKAIYRRVLELNDLKKVRIKNEVFEKLGKAKYPWPDNVRKLEKAIEKAMLLKGGRDIQVEDILKYCDVDSGIRIAYESDSPAKSLSEKSLSDIEKKVIALLEAKNSASRVELQNELGIGSTAAWKLLKKMREKKLIRKVGLGKSVSYIIVDQIKR